MCRLSWNLGASTCWNPQGLSGAVVGLLYLLPLNSFNFTAVSDTLPVLLFQNTTFLKSYQISTCNWIWCAVDFSFVGLNFFDSPCTNKLGKSQRKGECDVNEIGRWITSSSLEYKADKLRGTLLTCVVTNTQQKKTAFHVFASENSILTYLLHYLLHGAESFLRS